MDWNNMNYGVPEKFGEPCVIRTHKGNYSVATFELVGQMGGWITSDARIVDIFHVTHWALEREVDEYLKKWRYDKGRKTTRN